MFSQWTFSPVVYLYEQHLSSSSPLSPVLCLLSKRVSHFGTAHLLQPHSFLPGRPLLRLIPNQHHTFWFCSAEPWQSPEPSHFSSFLPYCTASINQTFKFFTDASWLSLPAPLPLSSTSQSLTRALAVLHVRLQLPALVTRTFHTELVLFTALTALKVFGTEALDLTGLVVGPQLHAQWTGTDHPLSGGHCAVMAAVAIIQWTQVCKKKKKKEKRERKSEEDWKKIVAQPCYLKHWRLDLRCRDLLAAMAFPVPGCSCLLPQSFSSEPSGQSSVPSQSFSAGRQMVDSLAHIWWESLHTSASQLSSSELSSQSLSPSHTQALLIQRATDRWQRLLLSIFHLFKT